MLRLFLSLVLTLLLTTRAAFAAPPDVAVSIDNFSFSPAELTVPAGTRVTWTNHDDIPHTVVDGASKPVFQSPPLDSDQHWSYTFDAPGTYHYFCSIHPHMVATITVK